MQIDIPDHASPKEAASIAAKAARERRKQEMIQQQKQARAQHIANSNAIRIFNSYFRSSPPDSWVYSSPCPDKVCCSRDHADALTLYGEGGHAKTDFMFHYVDKVVDSVSGIIAVDLRHKDTNELSMCAIGFDDGEYSIVELPYEVAVWIRGSVSKTR